MHELQKLLHETIVVDTKAPFVFIGDLVKVQEDCIVLENADAHDLRATKSTAELYILETKKYGLKMNRKSITILTKEIISFSLLKDVVEY